MCFVCSVLCYSWYKVCYFFTTMLNVYLLLGPILVFDSHVIVIDKVYKLYRCMHCMPTLLKCGWEISFGNFAVFAFFSHRKFFFVRVLCHNCCQLTFDVIAMLMYYDDMRYAICLLVVNVTLVLHLYFSDMLAYCSYILFGTAVACVLSARCSVNSW